MWEIIKKIISGKKTDVTLVLLDDQDHELSGSLKLNSRTILLFVFSFLLVSVGGTTLLFYLTPVGSLYKDRQEERIRSEVIRIGERIVQLEDSLDFRNEQLENMKRVIRENQDTTYEVSLERVSNLSVEQSADLTDLFFSSEWFSEESVRLLTYNAIRYSAPGASTAFSMFKMPVDGLLSQEFTPNNGHYGIDIAVPEGAYFRSVGNGTILHIALTISYGYVVQIQHPDGTVSVYKHASQVDKEVGDFVIKGEVIGRAGNKGILSSGPHLHLEIWQNGVPRNPREFLLN